MNADGSQLIRLTNDALAGEKPIWSPNGKQLVFFSEIHASQTEIYIVDADGLSKPIDLRYGDSPIWSPDGQRIAFLDGGFGVHVMQADGSKDSLIARPTTIRSSSDAFQWAPDNKRLLLCFIVALTIPGSTPNSERQIQTITTDGLGQIQQIATGDVENPTWFSNGKKIGFIRNGVIYTVNADGSDLKRLR